MSIWLDGIMGVVVGDALGDPVQFMSRDEVAHRPQGPVKGMEAGGIFDMPEGCWTDDSSMTLAALDSIKKLDKVDPVDIMNNFVEWYVNGKYTPFGYSFDIGRTCATAIEKYESDINWKGFEGVEGMNPSVAVTICGGTDARSNGNGSLMRIMPVCLYAIENALPDAETVELIHVVSGLTHNHLRSRMACGLYYFCAKAILTENGSLQERLQIGINNGSNFYEDDMDNFKELSFYFRLRYLDEFKIEPAINIKSSGYVVDTLEAAIWSLINTASLEEALLKAVNLGDDADTVGAVAGGLAGLYYGYDAIPKEWLEVIQRRDWIEELCK